MEKVIELITKMQTEVTQEGKDECATYDKFACWCKDTTKSKSDNIDATNSQIEQLSSDITDKTQTKETDAGHLAERQTKHPEIKTNLEDRTTECSKEEKTYNNQRADLSTSIDALGNAITKLEGSKPSSFLSIRQSADVLKLIDHDKREPIRVLLQQAADPLDPTYKFHSSDILSLMGDLKKNFGERRDELDKEWKKTEEACTSAKSSLEAKLKANDEAITKLKENVAKLAGEIAEHRSDLVEAQSTLEDDKQYLKDMTEACELRANQWDQRSKMRADELELFTKVLEVLNNDVKGRDTEVNKRALLQVSRVLPSFVQTRAIHTRVTPGRVSTDKRESVVKLLQEQSHRLGSTSLAALATHVAADPFTKVKKLIQDLIERLLEESKNEATKKGFCDTEMGKATTDRENRWTEVQKLSAEIEGLGAKKEQLESDNKELKENVVQLKADLKKATEDRAKDKQENLKALQTAKEGAAAVTEAIGLLETFYSSAAKAFIQASPIEESEEYKNVGFDSNYRGKQTQQKYVLSLLETIRSDFERTIRRTEADEIAARETFIKFERSALSDVSAKETKETLNGEDLVTTKATKAQKMEDLQTAQNLLDGALKQLENLQSTCVDTGMSYADRVAKRKEEVDALKKALCILDPDKVEEECQ